MFAKLKQKTLDDKPKSQPQKEPQEEEKQSRVGLVVVMGINWKYPLTVLSFTYLSPWCQ